MGIAAIRVSSSPRGGALMAYRRGDVAKGRVVDLAHPVMEAEEVLNAVLRLAKSCSHDRMGRND